MSKSIRYYYFTSIATVLVSSVLVMSLIQVWLSISYFREEKLNALQQAVTVVTDAVSSGQIQPDDTTLDNVRYAADTVQAQVFLTNAGGDIVFSTKGAADLLGQTIRGETLEEIIQKGSYSGEGTLGGVFSRKHYLCAAPLISPEGEYIGTVFAVADSANLKVYITDMMSTFILAAGFVLLVSSILALVLTNRTVIPIRRVSSAARRFGEGDYSARVPVEGDDELAQLAITFNEMASSCEATDSSRRSFMGNIAHELRTPMTTIKGFIDGMLDGTIPEDQRDKYLGIVSGEVGRLARLTQNMLDISKLEAGEYTPNNTTFDIWEPIASVVVGAQQRLEEKNVEVLGMRSDEPLPVSADEDFVHQVLFNIIDNAIKFTNENGMISVSAETDKSFATITVHNTGGGIPPDILPYIFDRFYKGDESRGLNAGGSGLGLHICKVLVNLMGGRIWAQSEEDRWTAFHFTLPLAPAQKRTAARKTEGRATPKQENALPPAEGR